MKSLLAAVAFSASCLPGVAFASQASPDEGSICVLTARLYEGSVADIRGLKENPVPESFRAVYRGDDACGGHILLEETLMSLHRRHGDEKSTAAALAFFVLVAREGLAETREEMRAAATARAAALEKWRSANAAWLASPDDALLFDAFRAADSALPHPPEASYDFLAELFLEAAEYYQSPRFLKNARFYRRAGDDAARIEQNAARGSLPENEALRISSAKTLRVALDRRIAVLEARLSRKTRDIADAYAAVVKSWDAGFRTEAWHADLHHDFRCELEEKCVDPADYVRSARAYWRELATVEMLMASDPKNFSVRASSEWTEESPSRFVRRRGDGSDLVGATYPARQFHANLARRVLQRPDLYPNERFAEAAEEHGILLLDADALLPSQADDGAIYAPIDRIVDLGGALKLIAPYEHPSLWKRLAQRYLVISDALARSEGRPRSPDEDAQYRHVRATLDRLEASASAD